MKRSEFTRWFNNSFWRGFTNLALPITSPRTRGEKKDLVDRVYESISSGHYAPGIPQAEIVLNKGHGVARTVPVFAVQDYCVYYFCIKELEDVLCQNRTHNTFGGWTLGGAMRRAETSEIQCEQTEYGRFSFNPFAWMKAFGEFNSLLFAQLDQGNYSHVLQFDLANFYDSIRLDTLERWIREESGSRRGEIITLLFDLLNHWNRRNTGRHPQAVGIPQDALADCSRILANYYLQRYDHFAADLCSSHQSMYFRYADDQMILLNDPGLDEKLLLLLTRNLDRYGLRVNQLKVKLWTAQDLQRHRCRDIQAIFSKKGDNKDPVLVKRFVEEYLAIPWRELQATWNHGLPLLNRLLWANLESLPASLLREIMERFTSSQYLLLADHRRLQRVEHLNRMLTKPYDLSRRLANLAEDTVHNSFHHEARAFATLMKNVRLREQCDRRLHVLEQLVELARVHASV